MTSPDQRDPDPTRLATRLSWAAVIVAAVLLVVALIYWWVSASEVWVPPVPTIPPTDHI